MDAATVGRGAVSELTRELRVALDVDAEPTRTTYERARRAADAFVDENLGTPGARRVTAAFAEHGPGLLTRFSEWALRGAVAWHESGHAVASWALGRQPTVATIIPTTRGDEIILGSVTGEPATSCYGSDDPDEASRAAGIIALAGDVAEAPFISKIAPGARAREWFSKYGFRSGKGRGSDAETYSRAAYHRAGCVGNVAPWVSYWHRETVALLQLHASKVEQVAVALMERRELDEAALAELLGPMPGGA